MRTKHIIIGLTLLALFGAMLYVYYAQPTPAATTASVDATTTIATIPVTATSTVIDAMRAYALSSRSFSFETDEYPSLGLFITSINGTSNANGYYWTLYINGNYSELGASSASVHAGDTLEWRYQKGVH